VNKTFAQPYNTAMPLAEPVVPFSPVPWRATAIVTREEIVGYTFHAGDLFHVGHLHQLLQCRKHCDYLIVGVLTDRAIAS